MAYDFNGIFSPSHIIGSQQQQPPPQHQSIWQHQKFQPMSSSENFSGNAPFLTGLGVLSQFQGANNAQMIPSLTPQVHSGVSDPQKADTIQGFGVLTWLSAKAGLITCRDNMIISFQLKDFCDQMLNDLTSVLRVGFTLSFFASLNETNEYTATIVQPVYGPDAELLFANTQEVDLEAVNPTAPNSKDAYSPVLEQKAIPALLAIFQRHGFQQIQLSSLHSQMSNCGDDELFRYVGTSSLKRRQFVERRTHLYRLQNDDSIILQHPAVYQAVYLLSSFLLRRGGATSIQSLFDYFMSGDFAQEIRDHTGESRQDFLNLLTAHNWVFSLFPNRTYVSVRRNLPTYDYYGFIKKHFPGLDMSRRHMSFGQPPDLQRAMSVQLGGSFASERPANLLMHQQSHQLNSSNSHAALWDSQSSSSQNCNNGEQWSPLFLPNTWINNLLSNSQTNVGSLGGLGSLNDTNLSGNNLKTLIALAQNYQTKTSVGVQADELIDRVPINSIGRSGCTCQCTCGRRGATDVGTIRGSTSRASRRSESPPSVDGNNHVERFSPTNNPGFVGDHSLPTQRGDFFPVENSVEKHSVNTNQRYYDPFGTADLLNGSRLNSLRIGN